MAQQWLRPKILGLCIAWIVQPSHLGNSSFPWTSMVLHPHVSQSEPVERPDCCGCVRWPHKQKSFKIDRSPIPSVAALTTAANLDFPLLRARTPMVLDHAFTNCPLHIATPPTVDFLVEWHPAKCASPNTSILSIARKLNLAATLWNSFNSSPVRRSSSSLTSSGGSCHFAVLNSSLIWLALGPPRWSVPGVATPSASVSPKTFKARETCCWSGSFSIPHCHNVSVLPKKLAVRTATARGPESHAPRNKVSACFHLTSAHHEKIVTVHQNVGLQTCGRSGSAKPRLGKILPPPKLSVAFSPTLGGIQKPYIVFRNFPHTPGCFALGSSSGNRT